MRCSTIIEEYEEYDRPLRHWMVRIISYRLGEKHICIVNNLDPGATICRVVAKTRLDALKAGLQQANERLSNTPLPAKPPESKARVLSLVEFINDDESVSYTVETFLQLPIEFRKQSLIENKLIFRDPSGQEIPTGQAMELISAACA